MGDPWAGGRPAVTALPAHGSDFPGQLCAGSASVTDELSAEALGDFSDLTVTAVRPEVQLGLRTVA